MRAKTSTWTLIICLVVLSVATCAAAQISRRNPVHNVGVALPSPMKFSRVDHYASEIPSNPNAEAVYHTTLKNTTGRADTFRISVANDILPDGLGQYDWTTFYCDSSGACHFTPWDYVLEPGESEVFDVHLIDTIGTVQGMALTTLTAAWGSDSLSISFATFVGLPSILLVDDDAGASHETYLEESVDAAGYAARTWDAAALGRPKLGQLESYRMIFWTTADGSATYIDAVEEQKMMDYLDGGGNLMLASAEYLSSRGGTNAFISDYLRIDDWVSDVGGGTVDGQATDPISDGMVLPLTGGPFPPDGSDSFSLGAPVSPIFMDVEDIKGIRVEEGIHKIVFLSFPIEDIGDIGTYPSNRATLVERIIDWFTVPRSPRGGDLQKLAIEQNVPNPFNPRTEIAFTVPDDAEFVTLTVHDVNGRLVRTLVSEALPAGPARAAWHGDDEFGRRMASGVYFARLQVGGESAFRKMMLLK